MKLTHKTFGFLLILSAALFFSCGNGKVDPFKIASTDTTGVVLVNQVGYVPAASKIALIRAHTQKFYVVESATGKIVFKGTPGPYEYWKFSGDSASSADFSKVTTPGKYRICIDGDTPCSYEFTISDSVMHDIAKASIKALYYNRCSQEITKDYGGIWARPEGHPDTVVLVHSSAASKLRPEGFKISSPGGWYDAGDYNKYIVNSGISTYTLLLFYQMFPEYCDSLKLDIPENKNDIPDEVDELLYNLRWMLTMQDPNDGGVYHKLTDKNFDPFEMPDKDKEPRYVVEKTTAAALDFAAVTAMASKLFSNSSNSELKELAAKCLNASARAMQWAKQNPQIYYHQPKDINTGAYPDTVLSDENFWARVEYSLAIGDTGLIRSADIDAQELITPSWDRVELLGIMSLALTNDPVFQPLKAKAMARLNEFAEELNSIYKKSPYKVSIDFFKWGSNSDVLNQAMVKLVAMKASGNSDLLPSIQGDVDYILGRNATGYCFVTGFGTRSPRHIHHRPSEADGVASPIPGFVAGGPNTVTFADCSDQATRSPYPAKAYNDQLCSYSTNEIAINWNTPLFFVLGAIDALKK